jgi:hypothetical protein
MGNSVFILGADASVHAGAPEMRDFLDVAALVGRSEPGTADRQAFDRVGRARSELQLVHSKARFDLRNLESVFAAFEMAELFGRLGVLDVQDVPQLTKSIRRVIVRTLETSMNYRVIAGAIQPSEAYDQFARALYEIAGEGEHVSVGTFNYDVAVDFALACHFRQLDYCLQPHPLVADSVVELMKLHGSLNWGVCLNPDCRGIACCGINEFVDALEDPLAATDFRSTSVTLNVSAELPRTNHFNCRAGCGPDPVVIPPTANKLGFQAQLQPVWARAASRLAAADSIYVIGYSWPAADQFFNQLFALGSVSSQLLTRFCVVNPRQDVRVRFRDELLGQQASDRFLSLEQSGGNFNSGAISAIRRFYELGEVGPIQARTHRLK